MTTARAPVKTVEAKEWSTIAELVIVKSVTSSASVQSYESSTTFTWFVKGKPEVLEAWI